MMELKKIALADITKSRSIPGFQIRINEALQLQCKDEEFSE